MAREETRCRHSMDYSFRLTARGLLSTHRQDSIYHGLCYIIRGTRNRSMGLTIELHLAPYLKETATLPGNSRMSL